MASVFSITSGVIGQASPGVVGLAIAYSVMVSCIKIMFLLWRPEKLLSITRFNHQIKLASAANYLINFNRFLSGL